MFEMSFDYCNIVKEERLLQLSNSIKLYKCIFGKKSSIFKISLRLAVIIILVTLH